MNTAAWTGCVAKTRQQDEHRGERVTHDPGRTARHRDAEGLADQVREESAEELRGHAQDQRQRGDESERALLEAVPVLEVGRQPRDAEVERGAVRHVEQAQQPHVAIAQQGHPERETVRMRRVRGTVREDQPRARPRSRRDAPSDRRGTNSATPRPRRSRPGRTPTSIVRQSKCSSSSVTAKVVAAPETYAPAKKMPLAVPRSRSGIQRDITRAMQGNAPASPAPNRKRVTSKRGITPGARGHQREHRPPAHDAREHVARATPVGPARGRGSRTTRRRG